MKHLNKTKVQIFYKGNESMGSLNDWIKFQRAEAKDISLLIEEKVEKEMYKDCKCNNCVWAYKEAHYCPLGRCINETTRRR